MYDSSLISIAGDRCGCLDANSSCLMLCFCLEANFLTATDASPARPRSPRELSRNKAARAGGTKFGRGASRRPNRVLPAARPWGSDSTRGAGEQRKAAPFTGRSAAARRGAI